jgi:hypothetical protein
MQYLGLYKRVRLQAEKWKNEEERQQQWHEQQGCSTGTSTAKNERKNDHHDGK